MRHLLIIWQLPQFALGILFLLVLRSKILKIIDHKGSVVFFVRGFKGGISLSRFIYLNPKFEKDPFILDHEYGHFIQSKLLGWLYLLVIGIPSIIRSSIWNRFGLDPKRYHGGYPENWADKLGSRS